MDAVHLPATRFWTFSLKVYGDDAVAAACLDLQDGWQLDVHMLLFALFAASQGRSLCRADIERLEVAIDPWRSNVVRPLRRVRRWLKGEAHDSDDRATKLRRGVLDREIESEAFQQALMERTIPIGEGTADGQAAADNLMRYVRFAGVAPDDKVLAGLATIVARSFGLSASAATAAISGSVARTA
jgi:uncharacterized protein (TIGR02444 family)